MATEDQTYPIDDESTAKRKGFGRTIGDVLSEAMAASQARVSGAEHMRNKRCALDAVGRAVHIDMATLELERRSEVVIALTDIAQQLVDWLEEDPSA